MTEKAGGKSNRGLLALLCVLLAAVLCVQGLFWAGVIGPSKSGSDDIDTVEPGPGELSRDGYTLEQVVILSRHNIRSPLSGSGSMLGDITPHEWFPWSSEASQLSLRGGTLETMMGQYFRKWMEAEELIPENCDPEDQAVRIYANSKQRTIATSEFFTAGLFPVGDVPVETHMEFDEMDPVFTPQLTFISDDYAEDAKAQIMELYGDTISSLEDNYELITDVVDMEESEAWETGNVEELRTDDTELVLEDHAEPGMSGSLKTACSISDALVLQYYEEADPVKAAFGNELTDEEWDALSEIKDVYGDVLFTAPLISANVAHPLLQEIRGELNTEGRTFSFLCGHDSNIGSVLAAMGVEDYSLPETIEKKTPIGSKLVLCKWRSDAGEECISADLVYQTTDQLRNLELLDTENHPAVFPLSFEGLEPKGEGLYTAADFMARLEQAIGEYDRIAEQYNISVEPEDAPAEEQNAA